MTKCSGITQSGAACRGIPIDGSAYCYAHHPDRIEERRRNGSKGGKRGGRGRPVTELQDVKRQLRKLAEDVMAGRAGRADAAVAGQLLGTFLRALGVEAKLREQEEILERIEQLEQAEQGGGTWAS